jgi:anti-sigma factor RsiW
MTDRDHMVDRLSDYAVGALRGREKVRVESHLAECAACRGELAALQRTGELLSSVSLQQAPPETWEAVRERIGDLRRASAPARPRFAWGLAMGLVAVLMVALGIFLQRPTPVGEPLLVVAVEADDEMQATIEGHLSTMWAAPLADEAAVGLRLAGWENDG